MASPGDACSLQPGRHRCLIAGGFERVDGDVESERRESLDVGEHLREADALPEAIE
jgi:hypothetical protein